jgi:hypothetical protein
MRRLLLVIGLIFSVSSFAGEVGGWIYRQDENISSDNWRAQYTTAPKINYNHVDTGYRFFTSKFGIQYEANLRIAYSNIPKDWDKDSVLEVRPYLTIEPVWRINYNTRVTYKNYFEWQYFSADQPNGFRYQGRIKYSKLYGNTSPYISSKFALDEHNNFDGNEMEIGLTYKLVDTKFGIYWRRASDSRWATRYNMIGTGMFREF